VSRDPREGLMRDMFGTGWDGLEIDVDKIGLQLKARAAKTHEEALASGVTILETEPGRTFLAWLAKRTILAAPSAEEQTAKTVEEAALLARQRLGHAQVFWMILHCLQTARSPLPGPMPAPQPTEG
jgi:hypothetical protein